MTGFDQLLALRPTNAVARLGPGSRLPLLSPSQLLRAAREGAEALLTVPVASTAALPGLLRAARDEGAVIGIACPHVPGDRDRPYRFFEAVRAAGEEARHRHPFFLQAGPIRLTPGETRGAAELAFRYVDAGFSLLSLDASRLPLDRAVGACVELAAPALERELPVEVVAPNSPERVAPFLEALHRVGLAPQWVRVGREVGPGSAASQAAARLGASLALDDRGLSEPQLVEVSARREVRKCDVGDAFGRVTLRAFPVEEHPALRARAEAVGLPLNELLALREDRLAELAPEVRERLEALSYVLAVTLLERVGASGSARRVLDSLFGGVEA